MKLFFLPLRLKNVFIRLSSLYGSASSRVHLHREPILLLVLPRRGLTLGFGLLMGRCSFADSRMIPQQSGNVVPNHEDRPSHNECATHQDGILGHRHEVKVHYRTSRRNACNQPKAATSGNYESNYQQYQSRYPLRLKSAATPTVIQKLPRQASQTVTGDTGVVSNLEAFEGTGAGTVAQETPEITFPQKADPA